MNVTVFGFADDSSHGASVASEVTAAIQCIGVLVLGPEVSRRDAEQIVAERTGRTCVFAALDREPMLDIDVMLRHGVTVIESFDHLGISGEVETASHEIDATTSSSAEYVTMFGSGSSIDTLNEASRAVAAMQRELPTPMWDATAPADIPLDRAQPSLRALLQPKNAKHARSIMQRLSDASTALPSPPLLIIGETGAGKTALAQRLHRALFPTDHGERPFREVSAPTIRDDMFNDQLFGHGEGAYTDVSENVGEGLAATFGTLFIDEIGDLGPNGQAGLLKFIAERKARIQGIADGAVYLPMHIIAATNRPLEEMVKAGDFRQELFNRFAFTVTIRPLRERMGSNNLDEARRVILQLLSDADINPAMAVRRVADGVITTLAAREYRTGNFRELRDTLRIAVLRARERDAEMLSLEDVPAEVLPPSDGPIRVPDLSRLSDGEAIPVSPTDLLRVARLASTPVFTDDDGKFGVVWNSRLWIAGSGD